MNRQASLTRSSLFSAAAAAAAVAVVVALAGPSAARADQPDQPDSARRRLEQVLSAVEIIPTRATLLSISPKVELLLLDIAGDNPRRPLARNRAITLLRLFPGKKAEALLARLARTECDRKDGLCRVNREQALSSYAVVKGPDAVALLAPLLAHPDMDTRMAAADAVRLSRSPRALTLLGARLSVEKSATVRAEIETQIGRLEGAQKPLPERRMPGDR